MSARCRTDNGTRDYIALVDLSADGCCVLSRQPLFRTGQRLTLQPESLAGLPARVQWSDGCLAGLRFDNPLYGPVYEHLAQTFSGGQPPSKALLAGDSVKDLAETYRREAERKLADAEARDITKDQTEIDRYRRMILSGPRPGLRSRQTEGQVVKLFLS